MSSRLRRLAVIAFAWAMAPPVVAAEIDYRAIEQAIAGGRLVQARAMLATTPASAGEVDPVQLRALTASLALAEGRNEIARALFTELLAGAPQSCAFARGAGLAALRLGDWKQAIAFLGQPATGCPPSARALSWLGVAYGQEGRWGESDSAFREALGIAPDDPAILNNAGYSLLRQGRYLEAGVLLERAALLAPGSVRIANNLDIALAAQGQFGRAEAVRADGQLRADRLNNAGYAAYQAGRLDTARAFLSEALLASDTYSPKIAANLRLVEAQLDR